MARWSIGIRYVTKTGATGQTLVSVDADSERTAMTLAQNIIRAKPNVSSASAVSIKKSR